VVRAGRRNKDLVYVGTETGLYVSVTGGRTWVPFKAGLPTVAVDDIHTQPRDLDLVVATRTGAVSTSSMACRSSRNGLRPRSPTPSRSSRRRRRGRSTSGRCGGKWGSAEFSAKNPPFGAWLDYFVPREVTGGVSLTITDAAGRTVRTLDGGRRRRIPSRHLGSDGG
jgi:hypothetical protein